MNCKTSFTAALIALGLISAASAQNVTNVVKVTGSTAFRGVVFSAATAPTGGIFNSAATVFPTGAGSGASQIVYVGQIGANPGNVYYALECSWTGSEAGIANVDGSADGNTTLANPGLPNSIHPTAGNLPGATTIFPNLDGTPGSTPSRGNLTLADTSQAVSLTKPPGAPALHCYGTVGIVTFTWVKGKNSTVTPTLAGDVAWSRLSNVSEPEMLTALGSTVKANFLTGNAADKNVPIALVGRNAGSGTRANTLLETFFGVGTHVAQFALNSTYAGANGDVLTYKSGADTATMYPNVSLSLPHSTQATTPNFLSVANDGYESGGGVANCLSCDLTGSGVITLAYLGVGDAKSCRDGVATANPPQPGGAVWLNLDGVALTDANVANGTYAFWGHEHLYGEVSNTTDDDTVAAAMISGLQGQLGDGTSTSTAAPSSGIKYSAMLCDKSGGGDTGYPVPGTPNSTGCP